MIESGISRSYKTELLRGIHSENDEYYMALYTDSANIGPQTQRYSSDGEVAADGYEKGGKRVGLNVSALGYGAVLTLDEQVWENATITAGGSMIYNASKDGRAVAVMSFGENVSSVNGKFTVTPVSGQLIRIV
jgi:hypothetical protein